MENVCELCQLYSPSGCAKLSKESCLKEALHILRGNVTNGDMIKTLFPNIDVRLFTDANIVQVKMFELDSYWWNAPYKRGDTE